MTYWISMGTVLLIGYGLIKWSGRANEQANEGSADLSSGTVNGSLGLRSPATLTYTSKASNQRENESYNGGEA
jgi:hypothetical protein